MKQFNTTKEELKKLGSEFIEQAYPLIDDLFSLAFWLVLNKRTAKKILLITYKKAIYYCDKTKADTDWQTWMQRIFFNRIIEYSNEQEETNDFDQEMIDNAIVDSNSIISVKEISSNQQNEKRIIELLKNLPQILLLPLILSNVYKLPYRSVAEFLDVPDGVIAGRIFRARKLLFKILAENKPAAKLNFNNELCRDSKFSIQQLRKTALLVDNELGQDDIKKLTENFVNEPALRTESEIQELVKKILRNSITQKSAPINLKRKIEKGAEKRFLVEI
jgi:DNA-directed RNA polymerase specialized sigma24 family protein